MLMVECPSRMLNRRRPGGRGWFVGRRCLYRVSGLKSLTATVSAPARQHLGVCRQRTVGVQEHRHLCRSDSTPIGSSFYLGKVLNSGTWIEACPGSESDNYDYFTNTGAVVVESGTFNSYASTRLSNGSLTGGSWTVTSQPGVAAASWNWRELHHQAWHPRK